MQWRQLKEWSESLRDTVLTTPLRARLRFRVSDRASGAAHASTWVYTQVVIFHEMPQAKLA